MVSIKKNRSIWYVFGMVLFAILAYLFVDSGFNTKTRVRVDYDKSSEVYYKVNYLEKDYNGTANNKYVSSMIDNIDIDFIYNNIICEYISGYYRYSIDAYLIAYEDDITNSLWERKYELLDEKSYVVDENNINNIKIEDSVKIDFKKYREEINNFIEEYQIDISGYLDVRINILESLNFENLDNVYEESEIISVHIPLSSDILKIGIDNIDDIDSYYEFSNRVIMNIVFIILGGFCLALSLTFLIMVISSFTKIYNSQSKYNKELRKILNKYSDIVVRVNKLVVNKKYNLIYVDSFNELIDVYNSKKQLITFKEVKRNSVTIFVIIDDDNAWVYKMVAENEK